MPTNNGNNGYDGSSTESEYYEDADYEDLGHWSSGDEDVEVKQEVTAAALPTPDKTGSPTSIESHRAHAIDSQSRKPSAFVELKCPRSFYDEDSYESGECSEDDGCQEAATNIQVASMSFSDPNTPAQESAVALKENSPTTSCSRCCTAVTVELARLTAFQRAHQLCHCCKISMGTINRGVVHKDFGLVRLSFCAPCFKENGQNFVSKVLIMNLSPLVKCSGCHEIKFMEFFHKRQRIYRPWEEQPGQKHFCSTCLPNGFECDEDKIVPLKIKCVKCALEKDRVAFIRSLQEHSIGADALKHLQLWVKDEFCICDDCMVKADNDAMRLTCYRCNQQLPRSKFPFKQQRCAQRADEIPGRFVSKPLYSCVDCRSSYWYGSSYKHTHATLKRKYEDKSRQDEISSSNQRYLKSKAHVGGDSPAAQARTRDYIGQKEHETRFSCAAYDPKRNHLGEGIQPDGSMRPSRRR